MTNQKEEISLDLFGVSGVTITEFVSDAGDKTYRLRWTDYVANEWTEYYDLVSTALARVANLARCLEDEGGFAIADPERFAYVAESFLITQTPQ